MRDDTKNGYVADYASPSLLNKKVILSPADVSEKLQKAAVEGSLSDCVWQFSAVKLKEERFCSITHLG